jgi:hypothetical protein
LPLELISPRVKGYTLRRAGNEHVTCHQITIIIGPSGISRLNISVSRANVPRLHLASCLTGNYTHGVVHDGCTQITPMPIALILVRWLHLSASMLPAGLFFVPGGDCRSCCKESVGGYWTPAWQDPPVNLPDRIMDTSRGAHFVVRLELVGRLNNERR